jgi:hypothetical protein
MESWGLKNSIGKGCPGEWQFREPAVILEACQP